MSNSNRAAIYSGADQNQFKMEVISLMKKIQVGIDSVVSKVNSYRKQLSRREASHLNALRIHEYKLKEILKWVEGLDDEGWIEDKAELIYDFETAQRVFHTKV